MTSSLVSKGPKFSSEELAVILHIKLYNYLEHLDEQQRYTPLPRITRAACIVITR